ncbi:MAG: response regulator [Phycisphaerales bacterium]|nr:MAG: response regulator [Phycisphaerales bacterium]
MNSATSHDVDNQKQPRRPEKNPSSAADGHDPEDLDRRLAEALTDRAPRRGPAKILIVGDKNLCTGDFTAWLEERRHKYVTVERLDEARAAVARRRFDLIILNPDLPDGDGFELARLVQKTAPTTKTIVLSEDATATTATTALRCGAVDFLNAPVDLAILSDRIDSALIKARLEQQREERFGSLQRICRELNEARHEISGQVDDLCNDLVIAYRDMADQMNEVAMTAEFRTLLKQELDVEELLRTMLEYVLAKTGPTNAAVFLPDSAGQYGLGAYVNYDCPRDSMSLLLDYLCQAICPQMASESQIVAFDDAEEFAKWVGLEGGFLADSQVIAFSCPHEDETMAVVVLFRNRSNPFLEDLAGSLDILRTTFAEQLATVIKVHHRASPSWPKDAHEDDESEYGDEFDTDFGELAA